MTDATGRPRPAALLAVAAAFTWSTYYVFVLDGRSGPPAVLAWPFLTAGLGFAALAAARGQLRTLLRLFRSPAAYVRSGFLVGMQVSVLAATYVAGPVDTSLLSLVGDAALTPVLLLVLYREGTERARSRTFLAGLVLSIAGATLTIVGGQDAQPIGGIGWLVAPTVPVTVGFYFLLSARASRTVPMAAVVGQSMLVAAAGSVLLSPVMPGGVAGLGIPSVVDLGLLVGLGLSSFFLANLFYFRAIELAGLLLPAVLMSTIPLFTLVLAVTALHETTTWLALSGIPIAVAGGLLALSGDHPAWTPRYAEPSEARTA